MLVTPTLVRILLVLLVVLDLVHRLVDGPELGSLLQEADVVVEACLGDLGENLPRSAHVSLAATRGGVSEVETALMTPLVVPTMSSRVLRLTRSGRPPRSFNDQIPMDRLTN